MNLFHQAFVMSLVTTPITPPRRAAPRQAAPRRCTSGTCILLPRTRYLGHELCAAMNGANGRTSFSEVLSAQH
ncbi:hypothetical protein E2C01_085713 [Portunus trituberculatus]|uniref:Uncharacterized protein n=1 Tax=Portunus trituberculatus TaxID=210409 RepID=A0A5B7J9M5_PORTR|nr:hypothetical protein [Portunus trituberculatus]